MHKQNSNITIKSNFVAWKHGHFVAAARAQLCFLDQKHLVAHVRDGVLCPGGCEHGGGDPAVLCTHGENRQVNLPVAHAHRYSGPIHCSVWSEFSLS